MHATDVTVTVRHRFAVGEEIVDVAGGHWRVARIGYNVGPWYELDALDSVASASVFGDLTHQGGKRRESLRTVDRHFNPVAVPDEQSVLIEAPTGLQPEVAAMSCHALDRDRLHTGTSPAWSRLIVRLGISYRPIGGPDNLAEELRYRLPGVSVGVRVNGAQHDRQWELDVLPVHGPPMVILGPK